LGIVSGFPSNSYRIIKIEGEFQGFLRNYNTIFSRNSCQFKAFRYPDSWTKE